MIGQHIQNYQVTAHLGEGGMGTVYKATDTVLGREVALKMLHTPLINQSQFLERFRKEARILAQLLHPNITAIYNFIEQNNSHYMVMEFVEGKNLDSLLRQHRVLSYQTIVPVFIQALEGLHHAHKKGIFHRDIKPSNLILTPDGTVKVMDFGIARMAGEQRMTQVNRVVGTVEFMAPELIQGKDPSVASDIYATAVTMYELLTGKLPFESTTDFNLMQEILQKKPPAPDKLNAAIPKSLSQILLKAMEKKPESRYPDARAFQQALINAFPQLREIDMQALAPTTPMTQVISTTGNHPLATQVDTLRTSDNALPVISRLQQKWEGLNKKHVGIAAAVLALLIVGASLLFGGKKDQISENTLSPTDSTGQTNPVTQSSSSTNENGGGGGSLPVNRPVTTNTPPSERFQPIDEPKKGNEGNQKPKEDKKPVIPNEKPKEDPIEIKPIVVTPKEEPKPDPVPVNPPEKKATRTISLVNRTEVSLYLRENINGNSAFAGQSLSFTVTRPVYYNGEVIVEKGASASGRITKAGNKKLSIVISSVTAANGQRIPLQETELSGRIEEILASRNYSAYIKKGITITL
ncbi:MAG: protein kinase [Chitinophagales bacterium]|nr:protein kinase [Chitinophagales bacterium]